MKPGDHLKAAYSRKPTPEEETARQFRFASWRFKVWVAGFGSYNDIHAAVEDGKLIPGQEWP